MRRRDFIAFGSALVAWPVLCRAQPFTSPVVGYLSSKGEAAEAGITAAIREGLG
jgi:hypothetical protein